VGGARGRHGCVGLQQDGARLPVVTRLRWWPQRRRCAPRSVHACAVAVLCGRVRAQCLSPPLSLSLCVCVCVCPLLCALLDHDDGRGSKCM
jgi:hypothetical protein